jgi:hypothetical protein
MELGSIPDWRLAAWTWASAIGGAAVVLLAQFVAWRITRLFPRRGVRVATALALGLATLPIVLVGSWLLDVAAAVERNVYRTYGIGGDSGLGAALFSVLLPGVVWIVGALALVIGAARSRAGKPAAGRAVSIAG